MRFYLPKLPQKYCKTIIWGLEVSCATKTHNQIGFSIGSNADFALKINIFPDISQKFTDFGGCGLVNPG